MDKINYEETEKKLNKITKILKEIENGINHFKAALQIHNITQNLEDGRTKQSMLTLQESDYRVNEDVEKLLNSAEQLYDAARKIYVNAWQNEDENICQKDGNNGFIFINDKKNCTVKEQLTGAKMTNLNGEIFHFVLPELAPNGNHSNHFLSTRHDKYIRDLVNELGYQYRLNIENYEQMLDKYTLCFIHHYDQNSVQNDTDNFEIKRVIDGLSGLLLTNDAVKNSHIIKFTEPDERNFTELYIVPDHEEYKNFKQKIHHLTKYQK